MKKLIIALIILLLTGCAREPDVSLPSADFFGFGEEITGQLLTSNDRGLVQGEKLILTTLVDLDNLYSTSAFGRALTESLSTCLFRRGFQVTEIRKTANLYIEPRKGELTLSRDTAMISQEQNATAIITGTYSLTPDTIIINVKMIAAESNIVLSVAGLEIDRNRNINSLLSRTSGKKTNRYELSAYER